MGYQEEQLNSLSRQVTKAERDGNLCYWLIIGTMIFVFCGWTKDDKRVKELTSRVGDIELRMTEMEHLMKDLPRPCKEKKD